MWGIHRGPVNSPHKWPVTQKFFHLMTSSCVLDLEGNGLSYIRHAIACTNIVNWTRRVHLKWNWNQILIFIHETTFENSVYKMLVICRRLQYVNVKNIILNSFWTDGNVLVCGRFILCHVRTMCEFYCITRLKLWFLSIYLKNYMTQLSRAQITLQ